jgi:hypothetical protein
MTSTSRTELETSAVTDSPASSATQVAAIDQDTINALRLKLYGCNPLTMQERTILAGVLSSVETALVYLDDDVHVQAFGLKTLRDSIARKFPTETDRG